MPAFWYLQYTRGKSSRSELLCGFNRGYWLAVDHLDVSVSQNSHFFERPCFWRGDGADGRRKPCSVLRPWTVWTTCKSRFHHVPFNAVFCISGEAPGSSPSAMSGPDCEKIPDSEQQWITGCAKAVPGGPQERREASVCSQHTQLNTQQPHKTTTKRFKMLGVWARLRLGELGVHAELNAETNFSECGSLCERARR